MLWFNIIDSRAIGAQGMEYSEFVTKIENNEISNILVEKNQNRAFVYMKEDSTYYMVKLASFGEMQNLVFNSEEYKNDILTYSVENFDYPPTLTNAFFILVLSFCIHYIMVGFGMIFKSMKFKHKKSVSDSNEEESSGSSKKEEKSTSSEKKFTDFFKSFPGDSEYSFIPKPIINIKTRFTDVIGLENQLDELKDIVSFLREPTKYLDMNAEIPKGVLLYGPSGTGKTLLARAIAGEANATFYYASASQLQSMYVGGSEKNIRKIFEVAKGTAPSIVFLDELDSIATQRYTNNSNRYTASVLNQLLTCMDGFEESSGVIVIAATNNKEVLDNAILRRGRFDRHIYIPLPDKNAREKILRYYLEDKIYYFGNVNEDVSKDEENENKFIKEIASITTGFSGSDIKTLINEAAILAVRNKRDYMTTEDIFEAHRKITIGVKNGRMENNREEKRLTAIHEAGHALVSRLLGKTPIEISIIPRDTAGGYNLFADKEKSYYSVEDILKEVKISLGGRAAEKVTFDKVYSGASSDLKHASEMLYQMYVVYGMNSSEEVSLVLTSSSDVNETITKYSIAHMEQDLKRCYDEAIDLLKTNISILEALAEKLLDDETMEPSEIECFFEQNKI